MATKKRRRRRTVLWVVLGLLSLCLAAVLVFGFRLRSRLQSLQQVRPSNLDMRSPLPRQIPLPCIRSWSSWVPREAGYTGCTLPGSWVLPSTFRTMQAVRL